MLAHFDDRVMQSPFVQQIQVGQLPMPSIRRYYHSLAQFVLTSNSLNLQVYYRQLPILRRHWDLLEHFAGKIAEEFSYPKPPGHLLMLLGTGRVLGLTDEEMLFRPASGKARAMSDFLRTVAEHGSPIDYWATSVSEGAFGTFAGVFGEALVTHYGFSRDDVLYWTAHHEQDLMEHEGRLGHGSLNQSILERLLMEGYADDPMSFGLEYCPLTMIDLFRGMLDDALEAAA
jgi:pyrroloquinoline quinone (PQQ) biosynthesis protein C